MGLDVSGAAVRFGAGQRRHRGVDLCLERTTSERMGDRRVERSQG